MSKGLLKVVVSALVCGSVVAIPAAAREASSSSPRAVAARACHNHAGRLEGDGEYTDGAILSARGISCKRALDLVKPRYHWLYAHWNRAYHHGFRIKSFHCRIKLYGPNYLKTCDSGHRQFKFV